jgi:hypothetical protein
MKCQNKFFIGDTKRIKTDPMKQIDTPPESPEPFPDEPTEVNSCE